MIKLVEQEHTLVYLLLFFVQSAIVSVVGDDFPQEYLDLLTSRNIDISGLEVVQGGKTFFWSGRYHNDLNSRDTLDTQLNVLADFQPKVPQDKKMLKL
jgi:hypothetical protein